MSLTWWHFYGRRGSGLLVDSSTGARGTPRSKRSFPGPPLGKCRDPLEVFLLAGESSGDRHGASLAQALSELSPGVTLLGVGGAQMRTAGVRLLHDSSTWGTIGIAESLKQAPALMVKFRQIARHLRAFPPQVLVLIDFGFFNLRMARVAKREGIHILYYLPPRSWSRDPGARGDLPWLVDRIATPFRWSAELLSGARSQVEWIGHPLLDVVRTTMDRAQAAARYRLDPTRPIIALAPGSRLQEIRHVLPVLLRAGSLMVESLAGAQLLLAVAPAVRSLVADEIARTSAPLVALEGMDYDALQLAQVALATSGTATLELACLRVPMVIVYRGSPGTWLQYRWARGRGRLRWVGLPNIIAQRSVVPELLQSQATPERIAAEGVRLLTDDAARAKMLAGFEQVITELGRSGAARRTATMVLELAAERAAAGEK